MEGCNYWEEGGSAKRINPSVASLCGPRTHAPGAAEITQRRLGLFRISGERGFSRPATGRLRPVPSGLDLQGLHAASFRVKLERYLGAGGMAEE
jgi:hypothetical protein